jgi:cyanophycinase
MMRLQLNQRMIWQMVRKATQVVLAVTTMCGATGMSQCSIAAEVSGNPESDPLCVKSGTLMICGGGSLSTKLMDHFIELGGGSNARIVIVTSASQIADTDSRGRLSIWYDRLCGNGFSSLEILHTRSREQADDPEFSKSLESATAVWFIGGNQNYLSQTYLGTKTEERLHEVLNRGGVIGGTSAGAAIMSRYMIADGKTEPIMSTGFGFLPGTIVDQHFLKRNRQERLMRALELRPGTVGFGIDEGTALLVKGRLLEVIGDSDVCMCLPASSQRPAKVDYWKVGHRADLVAWRRAALSRAETALASTGSHIPDVPNGTLVIVGGGPTPKEALSQTHWETTLQNRTKLAGGCEKRGQKMSNCCTPKQAKIFPVRVWWPCCRPLGESGLQADVSGVSWMRISTRAWKTCFMTS